MAFSPDDISGLTLWLKADAITGLSDGDNLSTWTDQSTAGNDATAPAGKEPTYETNELNSLPVVRFNGTADYMNANGTATMFSGVDKPWTVFVVGKFSNIAAFRAYWAVGNSGSNTPYIDGENNVGSNHRIQYRIDSGSASTATINGDIDTSYQVICYLYDGTDATIYVDTVGGTAITLPSGQMTIDTFTVGALRWSSTYYFYHLGDIAELLVYDSGLSGTNRGKVEAYLNGRWAIY